MCPIYEYECSKGCPQWEVLQKLSDLHITKCPTCKKRTAKRLISGGGCFILKGKGFYKPIQQETQDEYSTD